MLSRPVLKKFSTDTRENGLPLGGVLYVPLRFRFDLTLGPTDLFLLCMVICMYSVPTVQLVRTQVSALAVDILFLLLRRSCCMFWNWRLCPSHVGLSQLYSSHVSVMDHSAMSETVIAPSVRPLKALICLSICVGTRYTRDCPYPVVHHLSHSRRPADLSRVFRQLLPMPKVHDGGLEACQSF